MDKIEELLIRRVDKIYPSKEALEKVLRSGKKLKLYQGFDPSTPNLHIGHLVGLLQLRAFQQLGHEVIFLIGDFTGRIGDPTGKLQTRSVLTEKQITKHANTYQSQAGMILNFAGNNPIKLKFNSSWHSKLMFSDILKLTGYLTVPQLLERDMFQERLKKGQDIYLNEFMYPLMQGYDSVVMNVDLEIGGSDQMFNMLIGRHLMKKLRQKEKFVLTTKLLIDSNGSKIGKTEGNAINIANPPNVLYGQIMSLSDDCILPCFELATDLALEKVKTIKENWQTDPMKYKKELAWELVSLLNGETAANHAQAEFEKVHQSGGVPTQVKSYKLNPPAGGKSYNIVDLLMETKLVNSKSEAKRLVMQKAVEINQSPITNHQSLITIKTGDIIKVGKNRWIKLVVD